MSEQQPRNSYDGLSPEQASFLAEGESLTEGQNYARLDEALYRLDVEPSAHSFRSVAQEELEDLYTKWQERGGLPEEFGELCAWVSTNPWISPDEEEVSYIETRPGKETYVGRTDIIITVGEDLRMFFPDHEIDS